MTDKRRKRSHGEGSLYQRGRYWWARYTVEGRRISESTGEETKTRAVAWLRRRLEQVAAGGTAVLRAEQTSLADLGALLRADYAMKGNKAPRAMETALKRLLTHLGNPRVADLRHDRLAAYVHQRMASGAGRGTVRMEMAILRRGLRLAHRSGLVPSVPPIPMPAEAAPRQGFLERHELDAILAEMPEHYRPALRFTYLTGWRFRSEVRTLEWADVDLARGEITLKAIHSKNGESRLLPYAAHPELRAIIEAQRDTTRQHERATATICRTVFHRHGQPLSPGYAAVWRDAAARAGHPGAIIHDFRRSSTRNLSNAGVPQEVIKRLQGHKTDAMFSRYRIVPGDDLARGLERLAESDQTRRRAVR